MVHSQIEVIYGVYVTTKELTKWGFTFDEDGNVFLDDMYCEGIGTRTILDTLDLSGKTLNLYRFYSCSPSHEKKWLLGVCFHTHYRRPKRCEKCPNPHIVCDKCLGYSNAGYLDIAGIFDKPIKYPVKQCCSGCSGFIPEGLDRCKVCHRKIDNPFENIPYGVKKDMENELKSGFLKDEVNVKKRLGIYLWVDDCISCS